MIHPSQRSAEHCRAAVHIRLNNLWPVRRQRNVRAQVNLFGQDVLVKVLRHLYRFFEERQRLAGEGLATDILDVE